MHRRLACLLCLAALAAAPASAQTPAPDPARAKAAQAQRDAAELQRKLVALGAAEAQGERVRGAGRERLKALDARERALTAKIGANQVALAKLLSALQNFGRDPPPALLVSPRSARDAVRAAILIQAITPELRARGQALQAQAQELQGLRRGVAQAVGAMFQADSEAADRRTRIEQLASQRRAVERRLTADADRREAQARATAEHAVSVAELVRTLPGSGDAAPAGTPAPDRLVPPAQGPVIRRFGGAWPGHGRSTGWAWRTLGGAMVVAPAAARVDYAGPLKGYGGVVILALGGGERLVLSGLDTAQVGVGQSVAAGEPLGRLPAGNGPAELSLELRRSGAAVDPAPLFAPAPIPAGPSLRPAL